MSQLVASEPSRSPARRRSRRGIRISWPPWQSLQLRVAMAEATARLVAAEQAAALGRRTTAEHLLAAREMEDTLSRHCRSRSWTPPSSPAGQPASDLARLVQYFDDREARTQQAADEREARRDQAAAEREARREAQHAEQLAALRGSTPAGGHPCSFIPNKGFSEIKPFSGARGQDLLPWLQQFRSRATFLKTPADDVARELCLKLTGDALLAYNQRFTPDASPTFEEVAAQLAKAFIKARSSALTPPRALPPPPRSRPWWRRQNRAARAYGRRAGRARHRRTTRSSLRLRRRHGGRPASADATAGRAG